MTPQEYFAGITVEPNAKDEIWTMRESDGTDTFEYSVPASALGVPRARKARGDIITNPLANYPYTIREVDQIRDTSGEVWFHYVAYAPHYALGRVPAIPFATELGTTLREVLDCLQAAPGCGWRFEGTGCVSWTGDPRCPHLIGPQFSSKEASVLTQLFQISQTWGGRWRFDENAHVAYLECDVGAGSGIVADWRKNLLSAKRHEEDKPQQQVLITENVNGVLTGITAQMALAELKAGDQCDSYLEQIAQNAASEAKQSQDSICSLVGQSSASGTSFTVKSNVLSSQRAYIYEAFLLQQVSQVTYEATVLDVSMLWNGDRYGRADLGQWITIEDDETDIHDAVRVVGRSYNLLEPEKSTYELSNEVPWLSVALEAPPPPPAIQHNKVAKSGSPDGNKPPNGTSPGDKPTNKCPEDLGIAADWIPDPTCMDKATKLQNVYSDKLKMLNNLLELAGFTAADLAQADAALSALVDLASSIPGVSGFAPGSELGAAFGGVSCELLRAILEAELQVKEAQRQLDAAGTLTFVLVGMNDCKDQQQPAAVVAGGATGSGGSSVEWWPCIKFGDQAKAAVEDAQKAHFEYSARAASAPPLGCTNDCSGGGALSPDGPVAQAIENALVAACTAENVDTLAFSQHFHANCGDLTTDVSGSVVVPGSNPPARIQALKNDITEQKRLLRDASQALKSHNDLINEQIKKIQDADKQAENLLQNAKECVLKNVTLVLSAFAIGEQFIATTDPVNAKTASGKAPIAAGAGVRSTLTPPSPSASGWIPASDFSATHESANDWLTEIPKAADALQGGLSGVDAATSAAGSTRGVPSWGPVEPVAKGLSGAVISGANRVRAASKSIVQAITTMEDLQTKVAAAASSDLDPSQPASFFEIKNALEASDGLQSLREDLRGHLSELAVALTEMSGNTGPLNPILAQTGDAILAIAGQVASKDFEPGGDRDQQISALEQLFAAPASISAAQNALGAIQQLVGASASQGHELGRQGRANDAYLEAHRIDIYQARAQNAGVMGSLLVNTKLTQTNPYGGSDFVDRTGAPDATGHTIAVQRISVMETEPAGPHNVDDLWVQITPDSSGAIIG